MLKKSFVINISFIIHLFTWYIQHYNLTIELNFHGYIATNEINKYNQINMK